LSGAGERLAELVTGAAGVCVRPLAALATTVDEPATAALRPARAAHVIGLAGTNTTPTQCDMHHYTDNITPVNRHLLPAVPNTTFGFSSWPDAIPVRLVGWLEFNVPRQHKYGYIREERSGLESYPLTQQRKAIPVNEMTASML